MLVVLTLSLIFGPKSNTLMLVLFLVVLSKALKEKSHFLMILLTLEMLMLLNTLGVVSSMLMSQMYFYVMFFTLAVGEACVGLSCMIYLNRKLGSDSVLRF